MRGGQGEAENERSVTSET